MNTRQTACATGILLIGLMTLGCTPPADLSTTSALPDEYVVSVPGMH